MYYFKMRFKDDTKYERKAKIIIQKNSEMNDRTKEKNPEI